MDNRLESNPYAFPGLDQILYEIFFMPNFNMYQEWKMNYLYLWDTV